MSVISIAALLCNYCLFLYNILDNYVNIDLVNNLCFVSVSDSNMVLPPIPSLISLDDISQCSDDPQPKNKGNVGECFILSKLILFMKLLQFCHSCTLE